MVSNRQAVRKAALWNPFLSSKSILRDRKLPTPPHSAPSQSCSCSQTFKRWVLHYFSFQLTNRRSFPRQLSNHMRSFQDRNCTHHLSLMLAGTRFWRLLRQWLPYFSHSFGNSWSSNVFDDCRMVEPVYPSLPSTQIWPKKTKHKVERVFAHFVLGILSMNSEIYFSFNSTILSSFSSTCLSLFSCLLVWYLVKFSTDAWVISRTGGAIFSSHCAILSYLSSVLLLCLIASSSSQPQINWSFRGNAEVRSHGSNAV